MSKLSHGLVIHENDTLWRFNPSNNESTLLHFNRIPIGSYVFLGKEIFWSSANNSSKIYSALINEGNTENEHLDVIFEEKRVSPNAVAVDHYTQKLYVLDESLGTLLVIDKETKKYTILRTDLKDPREIFLDAAQGLMFILQYSTSVS